VTAPFSPTTAVITGAGRGIGRAVARRIARPGAHVALLARSAEELRRTAEEVRAVGATPLVIAVDLADLEQVSAGAERIRHTLGPVDVLINNAGTVAPLGDSAEIDPAEWAKAVTLNLTAAALLTFALLPGMLEQHRGRIVNVSSGVVARPGSMTRGNAYVTAKTALEAHTLNVAAEIDGTGVTANVYRPGTVDTAMQTYIRTQDPERIGQQLHDRFVRYHSEGALITPEHSANALVAHLQGSGNGRIWTVPDPV
jgi:3-oxoacyl-[acyl-carrier protein] reductase